MPEFGVPVTLETPRGTVVFNDYVAESYLRLTEFAVRSTVRSAVEAVSRRDGSVVPNAFRSGATPIMKGEAKASSVEARTAMLEELKAHLVSILRADGILRWTPTGKPTRRLVVRCLEDPEDGGGFLKTFQAALVSRTAHSLSDIENVETLRALDAPEDGAAWSFPYEFPMTFGGGIASGSAFVTNDGDTDAFPVVRLTGPLTNPTIRNATTARDLALTISIPAGSFLLIDMANETVRMNGDPAQSKIGAVSPLTANFWALVEGTNEIRLSASAYGTGHGATVYWRDANP